MTGDGVKVAVTGATGFIGWHLAEGFLDAGWNVVAVVRPGSRKPLPPGISRVEAALDADALVQALPGASTIVHAAGVAHARDAATFDAVNVAGSEAVARAAKELGARVVQISSQAAAGMGTVARPSRENDPPEPLTAYGRSKLAAERALISVAAVPWTILRPSSVYGPRDRQFLPVFRMAARGFFPVASSPAMAFSVIHVDDLTRAVMLAATKEDAVGQTLFLGHPSPVTAEEFLRTMAAAYGRAYRPWRVPRAVMHALAWAGELSWSLGRQPLVDRARLTELYADGFVCDVSRARTVLGFTAERSLPEGVAATAQWYRSQGWV